MLLEKRYGFEGILDGHDVRDETLLVKVMQAAVQC